MRERRGRQPQQPDHGEGIRARRTRRCNDDATATATHAHTSRYELRMTCRKAPSPLRRSSDDLRAASAAASVFCACVQLMEIRWRGRDAWGLSGGDRAFFECPFSDYKYAQAGIGLRRGFWGKYIRRRFVF